MERESRTLDRRRFSIAGAAALAAGLAPTPARIVLAHDQATPAATPEPGSAIGFDDLGLPRIDITITVDGFEGVPADIEAGRYLVTATGSADVEEATAAFIRPPAGLSADELIGALGIGNPPPADSAAASPVAGGPPPEAGPLPTFVYQMTFAGGAVLYPGSTGQAILDLEPGEWIVWSDDPASARPPVIFNVTGELSPDLTEPPSDINVRFIDFAIEINGALTAGDHIMRIDNQGAQPHFVDVLKGPETMTNEQIGMLFGSDMGGATPMPLPFNPDTDLRPVLSTATQSIGTLTWVHAHLDAGTYAALCFFPTAGTGAPHTMMGMHTVFTVS